MMAAVSSSETSVNIYQTTLCNIPEDSHLYIRRCANLKSHMDVTGSCPVVAVSISGVEHTT
jgi:hypothetical protein